MIAGMNIHYLNLHFGIRLVRTDIDGEGEIVAVTATIEDAHHTFGHLVRHLAVAMMVREA